MRNTKIAGHSLVVKSSFLASMTFFNSCYYKTGEDIYPDTCDSTVVTYSKSVEPVIRNNCYTCHDYAANPSKIVLQGYSNLIVKINDGKLTCAINHNKGCQPMPKNAARLSECNIRLIEIWIENGAKNN